MFEESEFSAVFLDAIMNGASDPTSVNIEVIHQDMLDKLEGKMLSSEKARRIGQALETLDIISVVQSE